MPAKSEAQRRAAGAALASHVNAVPGKNLKGAAAKMAKTMSTQELKDFARKPKK